MILFLVFFALWAILHSISASSRFKVFVRSKIGDQPYDGLYRLFYNVLATITFLPVLITGAAMIPHKLIWQVPSPFNFLFLFIQLLGLAGLLISLLQTDPLRFIGLAQFVTYLRGGEHTDTRSTLITDGTYRHVRHPLYSFSLLILWFTPVMTLSLLVFNIAATIYFQVGSIYEERRLVAAFGSEYEEYRSRVPRLFPVVVFRKK